MKSIWQGCLLSLWLFNLHAEHIIRNAGLDELQAGIKTARRNINNLTYVNDTTVMAESKEEFKNVLMMVKEESEKPSLKLNFKKTKTMATGPITSWQMRGWGGVLEAVTDVLFLGSKLTVNGDYSHEIRRNCFLAGKLWQT